MRIGLQFHLAIDKEVASELLTLGYENIMCKEYGGEDEDNYDEDGNRIWTGLVDADKDENGNLDDEWLTFEMDFAGYDYPHILQTILKIQEIEAEIAAEES